MDHGEHCHNMILDDEGMVMNANHDRLPEDCSAISQDYEFKIQVGRRYTEGRPGVIYGYSEHEIHVAPCSRIKVKLINDDSVRHQWMVHGLPRYLYPYTPKECFILRLPEVQRKRELLLFLVTTAPILSIAIWFSTWRKVLKGS